MSEKFEPLDELLEKESGECTEEPRVFLSRKLIKRTGREYACNGPPCYCDDLCEQVCRCDYGID